MSSELIAILALLVVLFVLVFDRYKQEETSLKRERALNDLLEVRSHAWAVERQQLLDRIQAPSFGEYKSAEIRMTKASNTERETRNPMGVELL